MSEEEIAALIQDFSRLSPFDAAHRLEALKIEEAACVLVGLKPEPAARAFEFLEPRFAANLLGEIPEKARIQVVGRMAVTRAADVIAAVAREEDRLKLLEQLDRPQADQIRKLTAYPEGMAGRIMTPSFFAFQTDTKVETAIQTLRFLAQKKIPFSYVYVTDHENRLKGVLNLRELLLSDDEATLDSIMIPDVFSVPATMDREQVIQGISHRSFLSVPVVDAGGRLLGTIRTDDLISSAQEEATEDIQKMFGAGGDEHVFSTIPFSIQKRLPWLYVNLATAFLASGVIALFEHVIAKVTALAIFLPIVASQGGNSGAQSLAVVMRGLVLGEVQPPLARRVIMKEGVLGLANGLLVGVAAALAAWVWNGNVFLGVAIGFAMVINLVAAGVSGAAIPVLMRAFGKDPAQSSNIILTTVTDCVGFLAFLGLAALLQPLLLKNS